MRELNEDRPQGLAKAVNRGSKAQQGSKATRAAKPIEKVFKSAWSCSKVNKNSIQIFREFVIIKKQVAKFSHLTVKMQPTRTRRIMSFLPIHLFNLADVEFHQTSDHRAAVLSKEKPLVATLGSE